MNGEALAERPPCAELPANESRLTPSGRWTEGRWLRLGDHFLTKTGKSATVVGLTIRMERVQVYNLQVKNLQRYAVGDAGVLVHNSGPKPSPKFTPPTNPPQPPPSQLPPGVQLFRGKPTQQYPEGYWKIEKFDGQGWQRLDPRTMKPGPHCDTHVPMPPGYRGPFDN